MSDYRVHMKLRSNNKKTGKIPVSTTERASCWSGCAFFGQGCYAELGHVAMHWRKVSNGTNAIGWEAFCSKVKALPLGQLWRHNQAGDLPGYGAAIDTKALTALVQANAGKKGFTYTHKPMLPLNSKLPEVSRNRAAVEEANKQGFTINLSGNNLAHADQLYDLGIAPVVCVLPSTQTTNCVTPKGRKVVVCPATQRDDVNCKSCGLCQRLRDCIVGFPAHGVSHAKATAIAIGEA
jgi:hypothetical protein